MNIQQAYKESKATPVLHRCHAINSNWHHCFNLMNRAMLNGEYVTDDSKCSYCYLDNMLVPVQSYKGEEYQDVLVSKRNPVNRDSSHIILFINVNGDKPRYKGKFVKILSELDRRETFNLHIEFSKMRNIVEVVDYQ